MVLRGGAGWAGAGPWAAATAASQRAATGAGALVGHAAMT